MSENWKDQEESEVRDKLTTAAKNALAKATLFNEGSGVKTRVFVNLETGLRLLAIRERKGLVDSETRRKLRDRVNIVLRESKPLGLDVSVPGPKKEEETTDGKVQGSVSKGTDGK